MAKLSGLGPVKLFGLLQRKSGTSLDAFRHHWRTTHKDEAMKLASFMTAYTQNHRRPEQLPGLPSAADGVPEIWFKSMEDVAAMQSSDAYLTGAYLDEPKFMEGRAQGLVLSERVLVPGPVVHIDDDWVRVSVFLKRRDGLSFDDFEAWLDARTSPAYRLDVAPARFTRSFPVRLSGDDPLYDAVESYWWPDMEGFLTAWGQGDLAAQVQDYVDVKACAGLLTQEERVIWPASGVDYSG